MPITLTINGESAEHILAELETFSRALTKPKIEWRQVSSAELDVRMAADIPAASDFGYTEVQSTNDPHGYEPDRVAHDAPVVEDKPKRKRRTKEELKKAWRSRLPPQEGDPDIEPVAEVVDDILDDDTPSAPSTATRDDVKTYMSKIIQQRLLTPAEIKAIFIERAGGATNAAAMDEKFASSVLEGLTEAAEKKSA